jgi:hypothetical protein
MTPPEHTPTPGTREHFLQVVTLRRWGTIQDYVELCRAHRYFTPAFYAKAATHLERIHVRRRLKQITNVQGWPVFGNIERVDPDGKLERVFLQEELFGPEEYRQIVAYNYGMARHHLFKAQTYRDHAKARYGLQLPLCSEVCPGHDAPFQSILGIQQGHIQEKRAGSHERGTSHVRF